MEKIPNQQNPKIKPNVWDCNSSLYDSFELKSFERKLHSAINSRTLSMPHLSDRQRHPVDHEDRVPASIHDMMAASKNSKSSSSSRISRSLQRFIKSMFSNIKSSKQDSGRVLRVQDIIYDKSGALSTIPEVPEINDSIHGGVSLEIYKSLVKRSGSERFTAATTIGISCA